MKYKTTIQIVTEAQNKDEAVEIAGEYLSGNIVSGVSMKCRTNPAYKDTRNMAGVTVVLILMLVGSAMLFSGRSSQGVIPNGPGINAIQPPLKTSADANTKAAEFKKEWQDIQTRKALDSIKK